MRNTNTPVLCQCEQPVLARVSFAGRSPSFILIALELRRLKVLLCAALQACLADRGATLFFCVAEFVSEIAVFPTTVES